MWGATHHEAVSALRNAGNCIRMTVLRERPPPWELPGPRDQQDVTGQQLCSRDGDGAKRHTTKRTEDCSPKNTGAVVCNGNGIVGVLL